MCEVIFECEATAPRLRAAERLRSGLVDLADHAVGASAFEPVCVVVNAVAGKTALSAVFNYCARPCTVTQISYMPEVSSREIYDMIANGLGLLMC